MSDPRNYSERDQAPTAIDCSPRQQPAKPASPQAGAGTPDVGETPRTDAVAENLSYEHLYEYECPAPRKSGECCGHAKEIVPADFARQLERELAEMKLWAEKMTERDLGLAAKCDELNAALAHSRSTADLGPVSDEEWGSLKSSGIWGHTRDLIDEMLAKRRKGAGT